MAPFRPLTWNLDTLASPAKTSMVGIPDPVRSVRYPFRMLRYWFAYEQLLAEEAHRRQDQRRLAVAEVGIDAGQMLAYARETSRWQRRSPPWSRWDGIDCRRPDAQLERVGYDRLVQLDIEDTAQMASQPPAQYDVVVLLHVVEHLYEPRPALASLARWLKPGGILIGGCPVTPEFARGWWQRRLRRTARPRGHVSVMSPELLRCWAGELALRTELLSGAFFMRRKGFPLENARWWLKANLAFGSMFPGWPGELYWTWRRA